jgi:hypothetical protein
MSKQRQKGTLHETNVVSFLRDNGFPYAERRALHGALDKGDVTGTGPLVWECKNHKELALSEWLRETEVERVNANADFGIVVAKRRGVWDAGQSYAVVTLDAMVRLLKQAGY